MNKSIAPLDLSWLLFETPAGTTHVGAMMLFKPRGNPPRCADRRRLPAVPPDAALQRAAGLMAAAPALPARPTTGIPTTHVGHLSLPTGSSYDDLLRLVSDLHEPMLDRDRLLFRCWIIDGVPGGRFAIYTKTHHSVVDGISGLRMLYRGLASTDERRIPKPAFALPRRSQAARADTAVAQDHRLDQNGGVAAGAVNQVSDGDAPQGRLAAVGGDPKEQRAVPRPPRPTNQPLKQGRGFATLSLPWRRCTRSATCSGARSTMWRHHRRRRCARLPRRTGDPFPHRLVAMIPVSLRRW